MATIKDVAKAAGVGTGTVSRALSGKGYVDSEKKKQIITYIVLELIKKKKLNVLYNEV